MAHELRLRGLAFQQEARLALDYKGTCLEPGYRLDFLVEERVLVELKSVRTIEQIHIAQLLTYLKLSRRELGLLINFNVLILKDGVRRLISKPLASPP